MENHRNLTLDWKYWNTEKGLKDNSLIGFSLFTHNATRKKVSFGFHLVQWDPLVAQTVKNLLVMQEIWVQSL